MRLGDAEALPHCHRCGIVMKIVQKWGQLSLPKALKSRPNTNKSFNLFTLTMTFE